MRLTHLKIHLVLVQQETTNSEVFRVSVIYDLTMHTSIKVINFIW